ncbi:MAG: SRPBCC family protein [Acidimicrobiia bacterium]
MGKLPREGRCEVVAGATPEQIWAVVADPTRLGEWSHETSAGVWMDGASSAVPGARYRARNRVNRSKWSRVCEVVAADAPYELVWRTVPSPIYRDSTEWRIRLEPVADGTRVVQTFTVLKIHPFFDWLFYTLIPPHRDRSAALLRDMQRLGEVAATTAPSRGGSAMDGR